MDCFGWEVAVLRWLVGKALMAMFGLGVLLCIFWWGSIGKHKFQNPQLPYSGVAVLIAWLPLQVWHAAAGRRARAGVRTQK
jgi:hypothetical protein